MRALVYRGPWDIGVEERPIPTLKSGEVLVEPLAVGICGSDVHGFTGESGRRHPGQVMGHEMVGRIAQIGPDVDQALNLRPGQIVTVNPVIACGACTACLNGAEQRCAQRRVIGVDPTLSAAFAEQMTVPAGNVVALPDSMPLEYGALIEPLAVGYHGAVCGSCHPDDAVLVIGGGPIGQACALAARRLGATLLLVSEPEGKRRRLLGDLGIPCVDPTSGNLADLVKDHLGRPATLVLDAVGTTRSIADGFACSEVGARIVLIGMNAPRIEFDAYALSTQERTVVGSFCYSASHFQETADWVSSSPAGLDRLIEARARLSEAPRWFRALAEGDPTSKVLIYPREFRDDIGETR